MAKLAERALDAAICHNDRMKLAQELGALKYQIEQLETSDKPQPDKDGWIANTGAMPECEIAMIRLRTGEVIPITLKDRYDRYDCYDWLITGGNGDITHYKPA